MARLPPRWLASPKVLVHGYTHVDVGTVRDVVLNRLVDFDELIAAVRGWPATRCTP